VISPSTKGLKFLCLSAERLRCALRRQRLTDLSGAGPASSKGLPASRSNTRTAFPSRVLPCGTAESALPARSTP